MNPQNEWLTPADIQEHFGFSKVKTYRIFHEELPTYKIGKSLLVRREDAEEWLEQKRLDPAEKTPNTVRDEAIYD